MVHSYGTLAHGLAAGLSGVLAVAWPTLLTAVLTALAAPFGVALPDFGAAGLAFAGLFMIGWGVKDVHTAVTSPKASSGLLCAESSLAIVALAAGFALKIPFLIFFAALPAAFTVWALVEISQAPPPKKRSS
jgi:hypothetical protein